MVGYTIPTGCGWVKERLCLTWLAIMTTVSGVQCNLDPNKYQLKMVCHLCTIWCVKGSLWSEILFVYLFVCKCAWYWIKESVCDSHSCETTKITVLLVMAYSPAWHCASDPSQHTFCPRAYHCYATKMYYALMTLCLSICNLEFGWINSCMDPLLWDDEREKKSFLTCWCHGFFSRWNLEMSSAAIEQRGNLSYLMKGGQHLLLQSEVKSLKVLSGRRNN